MKIKKYIQFINEYNYLDYRSFTPKKKIGVWLDKMNVEGYTINEDLSVDVRGDVSLSYKSLENILVKFKSVTGNFDCSNNKLTTLVNCPDYVGDIFNCSVNKLTSLKYCPNLIEGFMECSANLLTNFEGCPKELSGGFYCYATDTLQTLEGYYLDLNKLEISDDVNNKNNLWKLLMNTLESNESYIYHAMDWIKQHEDIMPEDFKEKYGYLLEFEHYTKTIKQDEN